MPPTPQPGPGSPAWPLHDLVVRTGRLVLRPLTEQTATRLGDLLPDDVDLHPDLPDLGLAPDGQRRAHVLQSYWRQVALWCPQDWVLAFAVARDGDLVGVQGLEGRQFAVRREVDTHSWLVPAARGQGIGKQMRRAVLGLAFAHLGAVRAVTEAFAHNEASLGVSRSLGYVPNGIDRVLHGGVPDVMVRLVLSEPDLPPIEVEGLAPCLPMFGLA